jgi:hypothetical protein
MTTPNNADAARMAAFHALNPEAKKAAITRLALAGYSDRAIAAACQLSVEQICRVLAEQPAQNSKGTSAERTCGGYDSPGSRQSEVLKT